MKGILYGIIFILIGMNLPIICPLIVTLFQTTEFGKNEIAVSIFIIYFLLTVLTIFSECIDEICKKN